MKTPTARVIEAARELIAARETYTSFNAELNKLQDAIIAYDAQPKERDWITCSDRMPDDAKRVLVYTSEGFISEDFVDKDTGDFMHHALDRRHHATHWRDLLEPPTEPEAM